MTIDFLLLLVVLAVFAGTLTGLTGASGMSVLISGLLLAQVDIREIIALTFVVTLANGLASAIPYWRRQLVVRGVAIGVGVMCCIGVVAGFAVANRVSADSLKYIMLVALFAAGAKLVRESKKNVADDTVGSDLAPSIDRQQYSIIGLGLFGILAGIAMGIMGGGGGMFIGLVLIFAFKFSAKLAIGTSIVIMTIASLPGLALHAWAGTVPWGPATVVVPVSMVSSFIAARLGRKIPESVVRPMLGFYLIVMVILLAGKDAWRSFSG